jgi:hypothetical protein
MAARRKARHSIQGLPLGWQAYRHVSQSTLSKKGGVGNVQQLAAAAATPVAPLQNSKQQPVAQQQYLSPEGLLLPSLKRAQEVAYGVVLAPDQLLRWLKAAAANPHAAQLDASTAPGQANMLGLLRCRALRVDSDRQAVQRRFAEAARGAAD